MTHILILIIYLAFISLGLPDALLGASWPIMYQQFDVPVSFAGIVSFIIAMGTVISSLQSDRLTRILGCGKVTAISVAMTAVALIGFSFSNSFWMVCLWAIPYGLGAGSVDAALNNYVALHYASRHMSWLHCMWGIGASVGPYIIGGILTGGGQWPAGYQVIGGIQILVTLILFLSLRLWKGRVSQTGEEITGQALKLSQIFRIRGAKEVLLMFFCYCALESTAGLWGASYLVMKDGLPEATAASLASMFYLGITFGRAVSGFVTMKLSDTKMIHLGLGIILVGVVIMLLPLGEATSIAGLLLVGLGCAPVYPCVIHSTPAHFGADKSQAIIGVQMASAYIGTCLMPPLFGVLADLLGAWLLPAYLGVILLVMILMNSRLNKACPIE